MWLESDFLEVNILLYLHHVIFSLLKYIFLDVELMDVGVLFGPAVKIYHCLTPGDVRQAQGPFGWQVNSMPTWDSKS